ncbi:MAG TPA: glycosyltransferase [Allosphingosinicella sp.]|jgi:GT2 family glycosyltransferase
MGQRACDTAVVLGFCRGRHLLEGCLRSLLATTSDSVQVIVVVNAPGARDIVTQGWPARIRFIHFSESVGNAKALNEGVAATDCHEIVLADYDLLFTAGWLEALRSAVGGTGADAGASMLLDPRTGEVSEFGIAYNQFNGAHPYKDRRCDDPIVNRLHFPQAACSGGMLLARDTYRRLGGFEEKLATMYGDVDFCLRLKRAGGRIAATPDSRIYHLGGWDSHRERAYKQHLLKGDHKGAFVWRNRDVLEEDLGGYFERSFTEVGNALHKRYVICDAMNVANPGWYVDRLTDAGASSYEIHRSASGRRDAAREDLLELFGYEIMTLRLPIAYFVDRHVGLRDNRYWWGSRDPSGDLVVDRNANVLTAAAALEH